ncbi:MAG: ABC transporter ATP-binding protein [Sedimentisphaerales bacterium]|nr:ABC transporter ATP-binding protein [Sedimentisphaerales bacterium]
MAQKEIIRFSQVTKRFGRTIALDNIDLSINEGSIVGLVGANGCGKSTLIRHAIGLYLPDSGTCRTLGIDAEHLTGDEMVQIGYVHQDGELLDWMTVKQHINYVSAYYDNWNKEMQNNFVKQFDLDLKARVGKLSPGKRQQLAILLAICHEPKLLLLDEPAAALDPIARSRFFDLLLDIIQTQDRTIIISSHILSDIEKVIDHVLIMDEGRIINDSPFDELLESFCRVKLTGLEGNVPIFDNVVDQQRRGKEGILILKNADRTTVQNTASRYGYHCEISTLSLEDIYKLIINNNLVVN